MKVSSRISAAIAAIVLAAVVSTRAQDAPASHPATPTEPIAAIIDAFSTHDIVALGEGPHNNEQGHAFRLRLIRDPKFAQTVNDIVVEFGNARYQDLMDKFVAGGSIPRVVFRQVWQNTTIPGTVWDVPIYEEFFGAVRMVNASLPKEKQMRVLLGDPPIDWDGVKTEADADKWLAQRDAHAAEAIKREVLARKRRALVIYGDGHLQGRSERPPHSLVARLEADGARVFTISNSFADLSSLQPDVSSWAVPSLALVRDTPIGLKGYEFFYGALPPGDYWKTQRMQDQFDAVLYLGPPSAMTMAKLSPALCADAAYIKMRTDRLALRKGTEGQVKRLEEYCAASKPKP